LHCRSGISAATREKILAAAEEHGYSPNPAARELITGESRVIGALIPQMNSVFFMDLFNEIKNRLRSRDLKMIFAPYADESEFFELLDEFSARRTRGVVFTPPKDGIVVPARIARNMTLVSLVSPVETDSVVFAAPDERLVGEIAAEHLASLGRGRLLHVTYPRKSHAISARRRGFERACAVSGAECEVVADERVETLSAKLAEFRPDGIFCHNDWLALSVLRILERDGVAVPESVSIIGVDDSPTFNSLNNEITTIPYPYDWCADRVAAEFAEGAGASPAAPPMPRVVVKHT
jgi:LacI family transcriptional regulator